MTGPGCSAPPRAPCWSWTRIATWPGAPCPGTSRTWTVRGGGEMGGEGERIPDVGWRRLAALRSLCPSLHISRTRAHTITELADVRIVSETDMEVRMRERERQTDRERGGRPAPARTPLSTLSFSFPPSSPLSGLPPPVQTRTAHQPGRRRGRRLHLPHPVHRGRALRKVRPRGARLLHNAAAVGGRGVDCVLRVPVVRAQVEPEQLMGERERERVLVC